MGYNLALTSVLLSSSSTLVFAPSATARLDVAMPPSPPHAPTEFAGTTPHGVTKRESVY